MAKNVLDAVYGCIIDSAICDALGAPVEGWYYANVREKYGRITELEPITIAMLHFCQEDANNAMIEAASFGRDCGTTASLAGAILGAKLGAGAFRRDWIDSVERGNRECFEEVEGDPEANFYAMAERLVEALKKEKEASQVRIDTLAELLARGRETALEPEV